MGVRGSVATGTLPRRPPDARAAKEICERAPIIAATLKLLFAIFPWLTRLRFESWLGRQLI
jgi:hypothetical protein